MLKGSWEGAEVVSTHLLRVLMIRVFGRISRGFGKMSEFEKGFSTQVLGHRMVPLAFAFISSNP